MRQKQILVLMYIAIAGLLVLSVYTMISKDRSAPRINIPEDEITYQEGEDTAPLLQGVTAWDDVESDVTDKVRVDSIIPDKDGRTATVVYAVYDSNNNVAKEKRTVKYEAAEKETDKDDKEDKNES